MLVYVVVTAVLPTMILGYPIFPCDGGMPPPQALRITGCDGSPYNFTRGTVIAYQIDFTANEFSETLNMRVDFTALGNTIELPITVPIANVCNWIDGYCPVYPGQSFTKSSALQLTTDLHGGIPARVRIRIYNANGSVAICAIINARIHQNNFKM